MATHRNLTIIGVEWGHCDPAGIVFYPNYFRWFDACTQSLLRSVGYDQRRLTQHFGIIGTPLVDAGASFRAPASHGDELQAVSYVGEWRSRSFRVRHRLERDGELIVEGHEVRVWAAADPARAEGIRALPIPREFMRLFSSTASGNSDA